MFCNYKKAAIVCVCVFLLSVICVKTQLANGEHWDDSKNAGGNSGTGK